MTYAPKSITALSDYWRSRGGAPLGIVGDAAHAGRASYHNGKDRILAYKRWNTDYSVRHPRDRASANNAAMALDIGRLGGSLVKLQAFSRWFAAQLAAGAPGTADVREFIYSPDGKTVRRWDGPTRRFYTGPGQGDLTHLMHSHTSFHRDSEARDKLVLFRGYFEKGVISVPGFAFKLLATTDADPSDAIGPAKIVGLNHRIFPTDDTTKQAAVINGLKLGVVTRGVLVPSLEEQLGRPKAPAIAGDRENIVLFNNAGKAWFALKQDTDFKPIGTVDCTVPVAAAIKAGFNEALTIAESTVHSIPRR